MTQGSGSEKSDRVGNGEEQTAARTGRRCKPTEATAIDGGCNHREGVQKSDGETI